MLFIEARNLSRSYIKKEGLFGKKAVSQQVLKNINLKVRPKQNIGVVGESAAGKSTLIETLIGLRKPTSGQILWEGKDIRDFSKQNVLEYRKKFQIVFQDIDGSLHPRKRVYDLISEGLDIHFHLSGHQRREIIERVAEQLMLPFNLFEAYPNEISGGEKKRVCIARSLVLNPKLLIIDEPTSGLDAFLISRLISILKDLCENLNLTLIVVSHDLRTVYFLADFIVVMYLGNIIEQGEVRDVFCNPRHPYTQKLLEESPGIDMT